MEIWKLLLITLLSAVVLGCVIGVLTGRHQLRKRSGDYHPLLGTKERVLYTACILLGALCIAFGVLYTPPVPDGEEAAAEAGAVLDGGMAAGEGMTPGGEQGDGAMPVDGSTAAPNGEMAPGEEQTPDGRPAPEEGQVPDGESAEEGAPPDSGASAAQAPIPGDETAGEPDMSTQEADSVVAVAPTP